MPPFVSERKLIFNQMGYKIKVGGNIFTTYEKNAKRKSQIDATP
jgi:hypothetical protein